jgi:BirA family biotin operon repressor/biotin-[acetyl-CoA-carboxylase] ligase
MDTLANVVEQLPAGWRGRYWPRLSSTQDEARRIVRLGAPTRSIVLADYQTAGRGRQARRWIAPPGTGLLVSMIFREAGRVPIPWRYTTLASVALTQTIECLIPKLQPAIKWPNDIVLLDGAKVAGVLAESTWDGEQLVVIVGVGVNVDVPTQILASIGRAATSLSAAAGEPVDRADLLLGLLAGS